MNKLSRTLAFGVFVTALFLVIPAVADAASVNANLVCSGASNPQVTISWSGGRGDVLYKISGGNVSTMSYNAGTITDTNVQNGNSYSYEVHKNRYQRNKAEASSSVSVNCGYSVSVSTSPSASWTLSGGGGSWSGSGGGGAFVKAGESYSISFTNPSGYAMAKDYPRIRNTQTYQTSYGSSSFTANGPMTISAVFEQKSALSAPNVTLLCERGQGPKAVVSWSSVDGANSYKVNGFNVGNSLSTTQAISSGTTNFSVSAYDSGGGLIASSPSASVVGDCNATISVTSNSSNGGSWTLQTPRTVTNGSGSGTLSYQLPGSTVYGSYLYYYFYANRGFTCSGCSWGGNSSGNWTSGGWNWFKTGDSYSTAVVWSAIPTPNLSADTSCNGSDPVVNLSWYPQRGMGTNPSLTRSGRGRSYSVGASPQYQGSGSSSYIYKWTAADSVSPGNYTYVLDYGNGASPSSSSVDVSSCYVAPTTATISINTNLSSAKWSLKKDNSTVVNNRKGNVVDSFTISGADDDFTIEPEEVSGYSVSVSNSKGGTTSMSSVSAGDSESFTITYTEEPSINISADPNPVAWGGSSTVTWTSVNTENCVASDDWSGPKNPSGSSSFVNITSAKDYTLTCDSSVSSGNAASTVSVAVTGGPPQCGDGVDNDSDGLTDTDDPDCDGGGDNSEGGTFGVNQCNDGVDNDSDGLIDTDDPDCDDGNDDTERPLLECENSIDDDGDGDTDYPDDADCASLGDNDESTPPPAFALEIVGKLEQRALTGTGTTTNAVIRVVPFNGFSETVTLTYVGISPTLANTKQNFGDSSLSSSEFSTGSTFNVVLSDKPKNRNYSITVKGRGSGGFETTANVLLEIKAVSSLFFEEF